MNDIRGIFGILLVLVGIGVFVWGGIAALGTGFGLMLAAAVMILIGCAYAN